LSELAGEVMREKDELVKHIKLGIQTFPKIINEGLIYADKTKHVWNLARTESACFLSRPRRFGKTLLLNTFQALFDGPPDPLEKPQGLFEGLWISGEEANYNFSDTYPIISLNMVLQSRTPLELFDDLQSMIRDAAKKHRIKISRAAPGRMFSRLIEGVYEKYHKEVVVLIDEYDYPVSSKIKDVELMDANLDLLSAFYSALKPNESILRFVFLTGVTRYALLWHSGVLNHLTDITMDGQYADICGFTHEEFDKCFADFFEITMKTFKDKGLMDKTESVADFRRIIFETYDGYSWDGTTKVLNPYSLLNSFKYKDLNQYWAKTEPSNAFLATVISKNPLELTADKFQEYSKKDLSLSSIVGSLTPIPSLFQTGYLTLDKITYINKINHYSFKIPNKEIAPIFDEEFSNSLFSFLKIDKSEQASAFITAINNEDSEKLSLLIDSLFGSIPSSLHIAKEIYYHSVFYGYLKALTSFSAISEEAGADGTPDIILTFDDGLKVIIEIKYKKSFEVSKIVEDKDLSAMKRLAILALETIRQKKYARPYLADARKILRMGVGVLGRGRALVILENEEEAAARTKSDG
jgi:hypothetical protein